nr:hypothetical protein [Hyalangium versicolor]
MKRSLEESRAGALDGERGESRRNSKIDERRSPGLRIPDNVARADVPVDDAGLVETGHRLGELKSDLQELRDRERARPELLTEVLAPGIFHDESKPLPRFGEPQHLDDPRHGERAQELVLVAKRCDGVRVGRFNRHLHNDGAILTSASEELVPSVKDGLGDGRA